MLVFFILFLSGLRILLVFLVLLFLAACGLDLLGVLFVIGVLFPLLVRLYLGNLSGDFGRGLRVISCVRH